MSARNRHILRDVLYWRGPLGTTGAVPTLSRQIFALQRRPVITD